MIAFHAGEKDIIRKKALTTEVSLFKYLLNLNLLLQVGSFLKRAEELKTVIRKVNNKDILIAFVIIVLLYCIVTRRKAFKLIQE